MTTNLAFRLLAKFQKKHDAMIDSNKKNHNNNHSKHFGDQANLGPGSFGNRLPPLPTFSKAPKGESGRQFW